MTKILAHPVYRFLEKKKPKIANHEAVQIFLGLFCTLDILPERLHREELSTETLVSIFEQLTDHGSIRQKPGSGQELPSLNWADLTREFLSGRIELDEEFLAGIKREFRETEAGFLIGKNETNQGF